MAPLGLGTGFYGVGPTLSSTDPAAIWTPYNLGSKLVHWYRFNQSGVLQTATGIGSWIDSVGSNTLSPTANNDADEQPALNADGTVFFEQETDSLVFDSALAVGTFAIYIKHNFLAGQTVGEARLFEGSADYIELYSPTEVRLNIGAVHKITIDEIIEGTPYVFGVERVGAGAITAYKDNLVGSAAGGTSNSVAVSTTVDITQVGDPVNESVFYEIIICDAPLTGTPERTNLYNYLNQLQ